MVSKCQGHRLDDQRSSLPDKSDCSKESDEDWFDMLWQLQSSRIEDQRSAMPSEGLPHVMPQNRLQEPQSEEDLFEMILSCQVS